MDISLLVICQPLNANFNQMQGVSAQTRARFYERLHAETAPFHVTLLTYPEEAKDPHYFQDANHPTPLTWLIYDRAMDAFFHRPAK